MKVGFVGLGRMGQAIAGRVLGAGQDLVVFNRTAEKAAGLAKAGARVASSIADACEGREVVITMLTDDAALREVTLNPGGLRDSIPPGAIHLTMGTHGAGAIQELAAVHARANQILAAPAYKVYGKIIVDESYDKVGFTTLLGLKDFNLIMAAADLARVPLPSGNAFRDRLLGAVAHGNGEKDWSVAAQEQARASGLE